MPDIERGPRGIALLICDDVRERGGGKRDLLGVFAEVKAPSFPTSIGRFYVLVGLGGSGVHQCVLTLTDEHGTVVKTGGFEASVPDSTVAYEVAVALHDTVFEHAGNYLLTLWSQKRVLLERTIVVRAK